MTVYDNDNESEREPPTSEMFNEDISNDLQMIAPSEENAEASVSNVAQEANKQGIYDEVDPTFRSEEQ